MERGTDLRYLIKSFSGRIFFTLIPFAVVVSALYTFLILSSIYFAEDQVLREYLKNEHVEFSLLVSKSEARPPPPSTSYLQGYWEDDPQLPKEMLHYPSGYHEWESDHTDEGQHILIADVAGIELRLYLFLNEQQFSSISRYETLLDSILYTIASLVIIASAIIATVIARLLSRPVTELANDISKEWKPGKQFSGRDREDEIGTLSRAFTELAHRLQDALDKEQSFTRHASHEMRTPLAIAKNALSVLKLPNCSPEKHVRNLKRIETACIDAERMLDVFLCLGRETSPIVNEKLPIKALIENSLEHHEQLIRERDIEISISGALDLSITAPNSLTEVAISNLIKNALNYGDDQLDITLTPDELIFANPIGTTPSDQNNYGYGLEIVRRICNFLNWTFVTTEDQHIFCARIQFKKTPENNDFTRNVQ